MPSNVLCYNWQKVGFQAHSSLSEKETKMEIEHRVRERKIKQWNGRDKHFKQQHLNSLYEVMSSSSEEQ